jgi:hypothetical protein
MSKRALEKQVPRGIASRAALTVAHFTRTMSVEDITMWGSKSTMPTRENALPGRAERMPVSAKHHVNGHTLTPPFPAGLERAMFGLGCFWGAE